MFVRGVGGLQCKNFRDLASTPRLRDNGKLCGTMSKVRRGGVYRSRRGPHLIAKTLP